jgi:hypothetical protein
MPRPGSKAIVAAAMMLAGCAKSEPAGNTAASMYVPPHVRPATPAGGEPPSTPISAYVGKYPHDAVDGVMFYDRTDVATALIEAVGNNPVRNRFEEQRTGEKPIFARGASVGATGCDGDCRDRNWTFLLDTKGHQGTACYHDAGSMGETSRWFVNGKAEMRPGVCPSA